MINIFKYFHLLQEEWSGETSGVGRCDCNISLITDVVRSRVPKGPPGSPGRDGQNGSPGLSVSLDPVFLVFFFNSFREL